MAGTVTVEQAPVRESQSAARRRRKREEVAVQGDATERYFLAGKNTGANGSPALDRECTSESEAMIESLKSGHSYFIVSEWKATADLSGKTPQINEAISKNGFHS